jgi:hypothetical protein
VHRLYNALNALFGNDYTDDFILPPEEATIEDMFLIGLAYIQRESGEDASVNSAIVRILDKKFPGGVENLENNDPKIYNAVHGRIKQSFLRNQKFWTNKSFITYFTGYSFPDEPFSAFDEIYKKERDEIFALLRKYGWVM